MKGRTFTRVGVGVVASLLSFGCGRARYGMGPDANVDSFASRDTGADAESRGGDAFSVDDAFSMDDAFSPDVAATDAPFPAATDAFRPPDTLAPSCNLIVNGSFESPLETNPMGFEESPAVPDGWTPLTVHSDPNDNPNIHHDRMPLVRQGDPPDGHQAVDLNGWQPNGLAQYVTLSPGTEYRLTLLHARNLFCSDATSQMRITIRQTLGPCAAPGDCVGMSVCERGRCTLDETSRIFTASGDFNMTSMWSLDEMVFIPSSSSVEIVLEGVEASACGPLIDYVHLGTSSCMVPPPTPL